ncbi:YopX family protein [Latilactobacillus curvatus]|nr:YopX family protein [Latilactobacillus curvatus]MCT3531296.1 hypothetical protein [Latilactobacillus curvatus]MDG2988151.1 YopX family protein [Latilactobacillus curvatus]QAS49574.1 hypothetical protein LCU_03890 [Latilactobacillus curvatus JCM 1096 = DSM 20019]GED82688.1 hypothetical protein LCU01_15960 [Latilactobacillus curvatus]
MREIKFRAWHKNRKTFLDFDWAVDKLGRVFSILDKCVYDEFTDEVELMQYTGLKDVNGVEIYEWDIVEGGIEGRRSLIEMSSYEWLKQALEDEFNKTYCNYKIIGNKFQNPELLEVCDEL